MALAVRANAGGGGAVQRTGHSLASVASGLGGDTGTDLTDLHPTALPHIRSVLCGIAALVATRPIPAVSHTQLGLQRRAVLRSHGHTVKWLTPHHSLHCQQPIVPSVMSLRKLAYHEQKLLKKVDFLQWKSDQVSRTPSFLLHRAPSVLPCRNAWPVCCFRTDHSACPLRADVLCAE